MRRVEDALRDELGDAPGVVSVALMGSVAKGTPTLDAETGALASDVDALVVTTRAHFPYYVIRQGALQARLTERLGTDCSLAPLTRGLLANASRSVWFSEVKFGGKTILGPDVLWSIPIRRPTDVDPFQGIVVGLNYLQELARVRPGEGRGDPESVSRMARALIGASDALAAARGVYALSARDRVSALADARGRSPEDDAFLADMKDEWERALALKSKSPRLTETAYADHWQRANRALRGALGLIARDLTAAPPGTTDRAALERVLHDHVPAAFSFQFAMLRTVQSRSLAPLARTRARAVPRVWLALYDLMGEPSEPERARVADSLAPVLGRVRPEDALDRVLDAWRAASPAFGFAAPSRTARADHRSWAARTARAGGG